MIPKKDCNVKFKAIAFEDHRKTNSTLEIGNEYSGRFLLTNKSIWWTDPGNEQSWVFWADDTAKIISVIKDGN